MSPKDQDQALRRSHRQIGEQLDLFHFPEHSPGMAYWHPRGMVIYNALLQLFRELSAHHDYQEVRSPLVCASSLWERSGHWAKFGRECLRSKSTDGRLHYGR